MTNTVLAAVLAIYMTESDCGRNVRDGDGGNAVGPFQTWKIMVREVNRVTGKHYTYADRRDFVKSQQMCRDYLTWHYNRGVTNELALASKWIRPYGRAPERHVSKLRKALLKVKEVLT